MWKPAIKKDIVMQLNKGMDHMALLNEMYSDVGPIVIDLAKVPESMSIVFDQVEQKKTTKTNSSPARYIFMVMYLTILLFVLYWLMGMFRDSLTGLPEEQVFINFVPPTMNSSL